MHPSSLLSYYPNYEILDEVVSKTSCNTLNLFIDLKNVFQSLYMEHSIVNLVESTIRSKYTDTSMFASLVSFLSFHKVYAARRNIKINFYVFFESGQSYFHTNIYPKYKLSRKIDNLYGLDSAKRDLFFSILHKNYQLMERAFNLIPGIKIIRLENLEADFIPYFLVTRRLISNADDCRNVIFSNDHDMLQCVSENSFIFSKSSKGKKLIKKNEVMKEYLKIETDLEDCYMPIAMSVLGCQGDDVDKVKLIGPAKINEFIKDLVNLGGGFDQIYSNVLLNKPLFPIEPSSSLNKYTRMVFEEEKQTGIISRNLKLTSFEVLSRFFDNPTSTEMLDKKKKLIETLNKNEYVSYDVLKQSLEKSKIYFEDDDFNNLYFGS